MTATTRRFATLLALLLAAGCAPPPTHKAPPPPGPEQAGEERPAGEVKQETDRNIRFGLPAPAKADPSEREAYLISRPQYTLSYNAKTLCPNWVSWQLSQDDIGKSVRGAFEPDPLLPKGFPKLSTHVYDGSGFDRGHMCPAQDRSSRQEDMDATFYTSNIVPQAPNCNQRGWERLEDYCRRLTREGHVLQIACGPQGRGGEGKNGKAEEVGQGRLKVTVPAKVWKVVAVLPEDGATPRRNTRVIAVIVPNDQSVGYDWPHYRVKTRAVEKLTGFTFFRNVPEEVAETMRDHLDEVEVKVAQPKRGAE